MTSAKSSKSSVPEKSDNDNEDEEESDADLQDIIFNKDKDDDNADS